MWAGAMPGSWITLHDNVDFIYDLALGANDYLQTSMYDDSRAPQGKALSQVISVKAKFSTGIWYQ